MKSMRTPGRPSVIGGGSSLPTPRSRSSSIANGERAKTPTSSIPAVPAVPSTVTVKYTRPPSRTSGASSSNAAFTPTLNAPVRIESLGYEGILRYLGEIPPKQGIWAGVELSAGFAGKGKNDGSTPDGKRYFECAPMCGVFVGASKLSRATAGLSRPPSVASTAGSETMSGLLSASSSRSGPGIGTGRVTPSARTGRLSLATSTSSNATTSSYSYRPASSSGRVTPSNSLSTSTTSLGPETPAARAGRLRALNAGATPLVKTRSQGAIVEKAVPVPAVPSIPRASSSAGSSIPSSLPSPTTSIASPRRIPSSTQTLHLSSPFNTPKARSLTTPSSGIGLGSPHGVTPRARIPSAVAMPPPPSPGKDPNLKDLTDLQKTTREIQERIRGLTGETVSPPSPSNSAMSNNASPPSAASTSYSYSSQNIPSPSRRPQSRITSATTISSRARSRSRAGSMSVSNSVSSTSTQSRPSSVASTASAISVSTRSHAPRSSTPGFGPPRSSTPGFGVSIGPRSSTPGFGRSLSRAGAETPSASVDERLERMQSRIAALEYENTRLRDEADDSASAGGIGELRMKLRELEKDLESANAQLSSGTTAAPDNASHPSDTDAKSESSATSGTIEAPSRPTSPSKEPDHKLRQEINLLTLRLDDASTKALSAHARAEQLQSALDVLQTTSDAHLADIRRINEELKQAQSALETRETELAETKGLYATTRSDLEERTAEIGALKGSVSDVEKRYSDELERDRDMWDVERKELRSQVDELRRAGQETIALYEEKLDEMRLASKGNELSSSVSSLSRSRSSTLANDGDLKKDELSASSIDHSALLEQLTYLQTKTASLTDALEDARHLHQSDLNILQAQLNQSKTQLKAVKGELEERVRAVEMDVTKKEREVEQERRRRGEVEEALRECGEALEEARREVEGLRMGIGGEDSEAKDKSSRDALQSELATSQNDLARATSELKAAKSEISSHKEEIAGLKHLVKELQRLQRDSARDEEGEMSENAVLRRENEMIKEENRMLLREMDGLKEEVKVLEEGLSVLEDEEEGKAKRREAMVNGSSKDGHPMVNGVKSVEASSSSGDEVEELKKEIEVLKKKLGEMDIKAARKAHDLNKEISELEALVETKIYREDELEQEIQRLNEKLRKANSKRSGKSSTGTTNGDFSFSSPAHVSEPMSSKHTTSSSIGSASIKSNGVGEISSSESAQDEEPVCEICEKPGHDIFSCDLLREDYGHRDSMDFSSEDATPHIVARCGDGAAEEEPDIWCEECEGHGHRAEECPYAGDVF